MADAAFAAVNVRTAQLLEGHVFPRHRFDDLGAGDEHVRRAPCHQHEVRQRGAVHRAARAWAKNSADLRYDAAVDGVAVEDLAVTAQTVHAFLNPRACRVVESHNRTADLRRQIHDLRDLRSVHLAQTAAQHSEILTEDADLAPTHRAEARDDPLARRGDARHQIGLEMLDVHAQFGETVRVQQCVNALPRGEFAATALLLLPLESTTELHDFAPLLHLGEGGLKKLQCVVSHVARFYRSR